MRLIKYIIRKIDAYYWRVDSRAALARRALYR